MRCAFGNKNSQPMYFINLIAQDCLEIRLDGFAKRRKPHGRSAIEQGTAEFLFNRRIAVESDGCEMPQIQPRV
jgi:hypothetical protein